MSVKHIADVGDDAEMVSLRRVVRHSWWLIAPFVIGGLIAGAAFDSARGQYFESAVQVQILATIDNRLSAVRSEQLVNLDTESVTLRSDPLLKAFAKAIDSDADPAALRTRIDVTAVPGSQVLNIAYSASTRREATRGARVLVAVYLQRRSDTAAATIDREKDALTTQVAVARVSIALLAERMAPLQPNGSGPDSGPAAAVERAQLNAQLNAQIAELAQLESRRYQLDRVEITPGEVLRGPSPPRLIQPPRALTVGGGGLTGLFVGLAVAAIRERLTGSQPTLRLALLTGASAVVTFEGAGRVSLDLESVMVCLDPKPGSVVAVTAIGRGSSSKVAAGLAELSARSGYSTLVVSAQSPQSGSTSEPVVPAPLSTDEILAAALPVAGVQRLSSFAVAPDDPTLLTEAFTAGLSSVARAKDCIVIIDAPPLNASPFGDAIVSHVDSTVIVATRRLSRRALRTASLPHRLRVQVVVVDG